MTGSNRASRSVLIARPAGACVALLLLVAGCPENESDPQPASAELGFTDAVDNAYTRVPDGAVMPLFTGGQGGSHIFATVRASGFPTQTDGRAEIELAERVRLSAGGTVLHDFTQDVDFAPISAQQVEVAMRFVFLDGLPEDLDGQTAELEFVLTSTRDPRVMATIRQQIVLDLQDQP